MTSPNNLTHIPDGIDRTASVSGNRVVTLYGDPIDLPSRGPFNVDLGDGRDWCCRDWSTQEAMPEGLRRASKWPAQVAYWIASGDEDAAFIIRFMEDGSWTPWQITESCAYPPTRVISGPFDDLKSAMAAYIMIHSVGAK